jgi:hypothetical protein
MKVYENLYFGNPMIAIEILNGCPEFKIKIRMLSVVPVNSILSTMITFIIK